jgi:hypothetical protein
MPSLRVSGTVDPQRLTDDALSSLKLELQGRASSVNGRLSRPAFISVLRDFQLKLAARQQPAVMEKVRGLGARLVSLAAVEGHRSGQFVLGDDTRAYLHELNQYWSFKGIATATLPKRAETRHASAESGTGPDVFGYVLGLESRLPNQQELDATVARMPSPGRRTFDPYGDGGELVGFGGSDGGE